MSTHNLSQDQCPVCRNKFANVYLKRRHMGVIHGLDESGETISVERREYLKHQSDKHYIRNGNRQVNIQPTTIVTTPQQQSFDYTTMNRSSGGKLDPATLDFHSDKTDEDNEYKMFQQMMCEYESAYNRVCKRKSKKSSVSEYTETLQWSKY